MSRSVKHTPAGKFFGSSDKDDKVAAHKKFRRSTKHAMIDIEDEDLILPEDLREVSDNYSFKSDGGSYYVGEEFANTDESTKKAFVRK